MSPAIAATGGLDMLKDTHDDCCRIVSWALCPDGGGKDRKSKFRVSFSTSNITQLPRIDDETASGPLYWQPQN